ncbi:MAG: hypothetical protein C0597_11165 [Marinilabiliales bacterium]|nr:MAG: hypothetical protein C0597_11165 [Marinilabiliales bacterium]
MVTKIQGMRIFIVLMLIIGLSLNSDGQESIESAQNEKVSLHIYAKKNNQNIEKAKKSIPIKKVDSLAVSNFENVYFFYKKGNAGLYYYTDTVNKVLLNAEYTFIYSISAFFKFYCLKDNKIMIYDPYEEKFFKITADTFIGYGFINETEEILNIDKKEIYEQNWDTGNWEISKNYTQYFHSFESSIEKTANNLLIINDIYEYYLDSDDGDIYFHNSIQDPRSGVYSLSEKKWIIQPTHLRIVFNEDAILVCDTFDVESPVEYDERWGLFDTSGKQLIPVNYAKLEVAGNGYIATDLERETGYIDKNNSIIIPFSKENKGLTYNSGYLAIPYTNEVQYDCETAEQLHPKLTDIIYTETGIKITLPNCYFSRFMHDGIIETMVIKDDSFLGEYDIEIGYYDLNTRKTVSEPR